MHYLYSVFRILVMFPIVVSITLQHIPSIIRFVKCCRPHFAQLFRCISSLFAECISSSDIAFAYNQIVILHTTEWPAATASCNSSDRFRILFVRCNLFKYVWNGVCVRLHQCLSIRRLHTGVCAHNHVCMWVVDKRLNAFSQYGRSDREKIDRRIWAYVVCTDIYWCAECPW